MDCAARVLVDQPSSAVLDVSLHGKQSDELALLLQRQNTPFAFVTGYAREVLPPSCQNVPIIGKPFNRTELVDTLTKLLKTHRVAPLRLLNREELLRSLHSDVSAPKSS